LYIIILLIFGRFSIYFDLIIIIIKYIYIIKFLYITKIIDKDYWIISIKINKNILKNTKQISHFICILNKR